MCNCTCKNSCCCRPCPASPTGQHCFCSSVTGGWWSLYPPPIKCCWCGTSGHGPHRASYPNWTTITVTAGESVGATTTQAQWMTGSFLVNGTGISGGTSTWHHAFPTCPGHSGSMDGGCCAK